MSINSIPRFGTDGNVEKYKEASRIINKLNKAVKSVVGNEVLDSLAKEIKAQDGILKDVAGLAKAEIKNNKKPVSGILVKAMKLFEKVGHGSKGAGAAATVTTVVLVGNVLKELVGTALYTVQALTNEDLPKDKRRFVGAYDFAVGCVSTCVSFILGVGFQDLIKNGYKAVLKPMKAGHPDKYGAILVGLSSFTSFGLQTIVGKRIIAPRLGIPAAEKIRTWLENREQKKNGVASDAVAFPTNKAGYVDLNTYIQNVNALKAEANK